MFPCDSVRSPRHTSTTTEDCLKPAWQSLAEGVTQPAGAGRSLRGEVSSRASGGQHWGCAESRLAAPRAPPASLLAGTCTPNQEAPGGGRGMAGSGWGLPRLDGFILTERLGSGTYATVYKAYAKVGVGGLCPKCPGAGHSAPVPANSLQSRLGDRPSCAGKATTLRAVRPAAAWHQADGGGWS